jgi:hypothetical protein
MKKSGVACTLAQALRLCTGRTAYTGSRGIALLFHDHGTKKGWEVSVTPRPLFTPGKDPVPIVQEAVWVPGPVWTGAENLVPTGIRSRTVQPVASWSTDLATRPTLGTLKISKLCYSIRVLFWLSYCLFCLHCWISGFLSLWNIHSKNIRCTGCTPYRNRQ